jgi:hypothetical protein
MLWTHALDDKIKRTVSVLVHAGLLPWNALLEVKLSEGRIELVLFLTPSLLRAQDGNLFWGIGNTAASEWPEPDRWVATVCNFLQLLAWEYTVLRPKRLYPTVRFEIVRDLYIREWQVRREFAEASADAT